MSVSTELANRILAIRYEDLPVAAVGGAKIAILDTVGVTLAGSSEAAPTKVKRVLGIPSQSGASLLYGSDCRTTSLDAALINGTAAHVLDFDDCGNTLGGHPSAPILPALLALAEEINASGKEVLLAYIVGFETEARIAKGVNFHHYKKGWHPTATLGIFGAAAACARLLDLPCDGVATALSLCTSMAAGLKANFGTMTKSLHVGNCSRNGLFAALLAREGFTAHSMAFEHKQGFLNVFNGAGTFNADKIFDGWATPLDIVDPGVAIKQYPCCGSTHPAIDASIKIAQAYKIELNDISEIDVFIHSRRLDHTNRPEPQTPLEAKFSIQYCVARALIEKNVVLEDFEGDVFRDYQTRRLMKLINASPYDETQFEHSNHFGGQVSVKLATGQTYSARVESAAGRTSADPLPPERLKAKFENCAGRVFSADQVAALYTSLRNFEEMRKVRDLTALMTPSNLHSNAI